MMKEQGIDGAKTFYKNMKSDLDSILEPAHVDSLVQKSEGSLKLDVPMQAAPTATAPNKVDTANLPVKDSTVTTTLVQEQTGEVAAKNTPKTVAEHKAPAPKDS